MLAYFCYITFIIGIFDAISGASATPRPMGLHAFQFPRKRQTGLPDNLPSQCQSLCASVDESVSQGCQVSVCCKSAFEMNYFNCFMCVAKALNVTDFSVPQMDVDMLFNDCASAGLPVPKLTYPGQNPNRALSSVLGGTMEKSTSLGATLPPSQPSITSGQATIVSQPFGLQTTPSASSPGGFSQITVTALGTATNTDTPTPTSSTAVGKDISVGKIVLFLGIVLFQAI